MVSRRRLREPDVAGIAGELTAFEGADDGVTVADFAPRCVHEISATLHFGEKLVVEEALGFRMKRRVDRDDVADLDHVLDDWDAMRDSVPFRPPRAVDAYRSSAGACRRA